MLRKEGRYILGTIKEVARELYNPNIKDFTERFIDCDFALVYDGDFDLFNDNLESICYNAEGWYGIKRIDTGFDNVDNVDLFADYYGGGCGTYRLMGDWISNTEIVRRITEMIIKVLSYQEGNITEDHIIICDTMEWRN